MWHIPLLYVQWKTRDGQRNCLKHVEFYSKNKFEKLVHLVSFIIRNYVHLCSSDTDEPCVSCKPWRICFFRDQRHWVDIRYWCQGISKHYGADSSWLLWHDVGSTQQTLVMVNSGECANYFAWADWSKCLRNVMSCLVFRPLILLDFLIMWNNFKFIAPCIILIVE